MGRPSLNVTSIQSTSNQSLVSPGQPEGRSLSISFSGVASPETTAEPQSTTAIPTRWTKELEHRLRVAQRNLEEHQRRWSPGQEDYLVEVEALQKLKHRFHKFAKRRAKDQGKEGRRLSRAASVGSADTKVDDREIKASNSPSTEKRPGCFLRRLSLVRSKTS